MYILSAAQIKAWDAYTILHEPISSLDLMERAATACASWIESHCTQKGISIFCGKGNNGGDGLVIARLLLQKRYTVTIYILENGKRGSDDFQANLQRLHGLTKNIHFIQDESHLPKIRGEEWVVDALFGTGLQRPLTGLAALLVDSINLSGSFVISIDLPSGLFADRSSLHMPVIAADVTLSFQCYKPALLMQENGPFTGHVIILDIGLHPEFLQQQIFTRQLIDLSLSRTLYKRRNPFAHKGSFGHALLVAGSWGKMGAGVLAAKACVHTGAGLTSVCIPACGYTIMQSAVPEAMVVVDENEKWLSQFPAEPEHYTAIGIGPGMGTADETITLLSFLCKRYQKPMVIDADALNGIAHNKELLTSLPSFSILTPHPKEFERLFGEQKNDFDRMEAASKAAAQYRLIIVLKSHHTIIATPGGQLFFNASGNAGMAKGGSGDVLTGIITSLLAQGYQPLHAALLGVWLHGAAGDAAAATFAEETITATDIVAHLSFPFRQLKQE